MIRVHAHLRVFSAGLVMASLDSRSASSSHIHAPSSAATPPIARELPFGVTIIIGGTNLRLSLSALQLTAPVDATISWQELLRTIACDDQPRDLTALRARTFQEIGKRFVSFIENHAALDHRGPPLSCLHTIIFSVAGIVDGNCVSLTNVPLGIVRQDIAREILGAINSALAQRGFEGCYPKVVAVVNDAVAGLMGEMQAGGLQGVRNGAFIILGTGMGGICSVDGVPYVALDELGHRFLIRGPERSVRLLVGDEIAPYLGDTGEFRVLAGDEVYAEHYLAGPWVATRFVKTVAEGGLSLVEALAQKTANSSGISASHIQAGLGELVKLSWDELHLWGQRAPSDIVTCVNQFLFTPSAGEIVEATRNKRSGTLDPGETVTLMGYHAWRDYFELLGRCGGVLATAFHSKGSPMERIVLGGGIGEACNHYPAIWRKHAYQVLKSSSGLSPGSITFSPMRPTQRENALTDASIKEADGSSSTVYH